METGPSRKPFPFLLMDVCLLTGMPFNVGCRSFFCGVFLEPFSPVSRMNQVSMLPIGGHRITGQDVRQQNGI